MRSFVDDLRHALRRLRHAPAFTLIVVATLALGIGANAAIFSVVDTVLLKPLPYRQPDQLVTIYHHYPELDLDAPVSAPGFTDYRDRTHSFSSVAVEQTWNVNLTGAGEPQRLRGEHVSGQLFHLLGVAPLVGRPINDADITAGRDHLVVVSYGLWQRVFGGDPQILGRSIQLNGEAYQVIGVMPRQFVDPWTTRTEVWAPLVFTPAQLAVTNYTNESYALTARLKPGVTEAAATSEMHAFAEQLKTDYPKQFTAQWTLKVVTMNAVATGAVRPALLLLLGAVGFVLLIACANVANLLLARAASRYREVAIRTALGAKRWHIVRQLLAESLLLSTGGGAIGLLLAYGGIRALVAANPSNLPRVDELAINGPVIGFTFLVALGTGVLFGLVPALQTWKLSLQGSLKDGARGGTSDGRSHLVRRALVVAEIALALTLLTGGGLLIRSFARLTGVNPGFDPHHVLSFGVSLPTAQYANDTTRTNFWSAATAAIAQVPGVRAVGTTTVEPFGGGWSTGSFNVAGYTPPPNAPGPWGDFRVVTPGFFRTLGIHVDKGRTFGPQDDDHGQAVVVVDQEFVHRFFQPGVDPIGKRIYFGPATPDSTTQFITIVGVVDHTAHEGLDAAPRVQVYFNTLQPAAFGGGIRGSSVLVRTVGDPLAAVPAVRAALHRVDPDMPMANISTMDQLVSQSLGQRRLSTILLGGFAGLALLLASLGIYGVMSYAVTQRTRELGVRVALGASRQNVLGLVLRQGFLLAAIGVAIGVAGALQLTGLISSQLYDTPATDPMTFLSVTVTLLAVALVATLIPAMRATRVDPLVALREE
jgi:putative ABC transport system permease protein